MQPSQRYYKSLFCNLHIITNINLRFQTIFHLHEDKPDGIFDIHNTVTSDRKCQT